MKRACGWWFPDAEEHFPAWMEEKNQSVDGRLGYQYHKLSASLEFCKSFRVAVDVGAHIGTWSFYLAKRFEQVHAFEPVEDFRACFIRNVDQERTMLYPYALGASQARVGMHIVPADTGGTYVSGHGDIEMRTLDSFDLRDLSYLKVDCEGGELAVLQGAVETLKRFRPCCVIEQKQHRQLADGAVKGTPAVDLLLAMGAKQRALLSGDHILTW